MAVVGTLLSSSQITSLIQQASAAYQLPAATLQTQEVTFKAQISALGKVQGALSSLQSALSSLADVANISQRIISAAPTGIIQATVTNDAAVGSYSLSGIQLARAETLISSGSSSSSGSLGSGSISIKVGNNSAVTISIGSGSSSLAGIAAAIDQADAGVSATVLFDGSTYHLVLNGEDTGTAKAFTVSGTGGLAGLSYYAGASGLTLSQPALNAGFSLNGIPITSGSNKITGVIPGVTLTLAASGSTAVTVSQSTSALDGAAQSVVQALNDALITINQETAFSKTSGAGPLLGNVGLEVLRSGLLNAVTAKLGVGAGTGSQYASLSTIGFNIASGGKVTFDDTAFQAAAKTNYSAVASLLGAVGVASNPNVAVDSLAATPPGSYAVNVTSNANGTIVGTINGLAASGTNGVLFVNDPGSLFGLALKVQPGVTGNLGTITVSEGLYGSLSSLVSAALASGTGGVAGQISGLNASVSEMDDKIKALQKHATEQTQLLTAQFTAAQKTMSQLQIVSNFLSSFFNQPSGGIGG